jgi:hypothetical protein
MSQAAWTLLGVAVGALIGGGTQIFQDWRKDRSVQKKQTAQARAEIKVVARLIADEVDTLRFQMAELAKRGRSLKTPFPQLPHYLPVDEWEKHKPVLAGVVDDEVWSDLTALYYNAKSLRARFSSEPPDTALEPERITMLQDCVQGAEELKNRLQDVSTSP